MKRIIFKVLYIAMILFGIFAIYTFVFVSHIGVFKKVVLIVVAAGIALLGISGFLKSKRKREEE